MSAPKFVHGFLQSVVGRHAIRFHPMREYSADGIIQRAWVEGKRIKYEILEESGRRVIVYADDCGHLGEKIEVNA